MSSPGATSAAVFAFVESKTKFTSTFVVATLLQTRAPTGKLDPSADR